MPYDVCNMVGSHYIYSCTVSVAIHYIYTMHCSITIYSMHWAVQGVNFLLFANEIITPLQTREGSLSQHCNRTMLTAWNCMGRSLNTGQRMPALTLWHKAFGGEIDKVDFLMLGLPCCKKGGCFWPASISYIIFSMCLKYDSLRNALIRCIKVTI